MMSHNNSQCLWENASTELNQNREALMKNDI